MPLRSHERRNWVMERLAEQEVEAEAIRQKIEQRYPTAELRQRLRALESRA